MPLKSNERGKMLGFDCSGRNKTVILKPNHTRYGSIEFGALLAYEKADPSN